MHIKGSRKDAGRQCRTENSLEMSATFRFFVLFLLGGANCAFFDLTDVEDPLSLLWHTKDSVEPYKSRGCFGMLLDGSIASGQCKRKHECLLAGGKVYYNYGSCGLLSTCCIQPTCSHKTRSKISYFESNEFSRNFTECTFVVEAQNDNICQMRIDFESFKLSLPERRAVGQVSDTTQLYQRQCLTDSLKISPDTYNIPVFCGNNYKQHVYVHLYNERQVTLRLRLENRQTTTNPNVISNPHWKLKITQLECPGRKNFFTKHSFNLGDDFNLLAPAGTIQYFLAPSGRIRSFGFDGTAGSYLSGLNYSIAFKRTPSVNCIRFSPNFITLRNSQGTPDQSGFCLDYLFIPGLQTDLLGKYGSQLCSMIDHVTPTTKNFHSTVPGPFYIHFFSQEAYVGNEEDTLNAFDLQYDLTSCT